MKNLKRVLALSMAGCMAVGVLAGCNNNSGGSSGGADDEDKP